MKKNNTIEANVRNIIALCHILDNYSEFTKNLTRFISTKDNREDVYNLDRITHGGLVVGSRKVKKFYQENKDVLDTINKYSDISNYINNNYDCHGNFLEDSSLNFFYQYLLNHKGELEQILSVLEKLKQLGFDKFKFNKDIDFTQYEYEMFVFFNRNLHITYLDNMQVIPNYQNDIVRYRSTDSNYTIRTELILGSFSKYGKTITLNSLVFDVKRLPNNIDKENIFDGLIRLKEEQSKNCTIVRNSVDLSISIGDLQLQFYKTSKTIEGLSDIANKNELKEVLLRIKEDLDILQNMSTEYDNSVVQQDSSISHEILKQQKQMCLRMIELSRIDID